MAAIVEPEDRQERLMHLIRVVQHDVPPTNHYEEEVVNAAAETLAVTYAMSAYDARRRGVRNMLFTHFIDQPTIFYVCKTRGFTAFNFFAFARMYTLRP